jgi:hypothetical protein
MSEDKCCEGGECKEESDCHGCGCCSREEIDVDSLGPEMVELAKLFDEVNDNLLNALKARKQILESVHEKASQSPEMKEKIDKLLSSRHPVLLQFVFGQ